MKRVSKRTQSNLNRKDEATTGGGNTTKKSQEPKKKGTEKVYNQNQLRTQKQNTILNPKELERKFNLIESSYRIKYPSLKDEYFETKPGHFPNFASYIAVKTNRTRTEVEKEIYDWEDAPD